MNDFTQEQSEREKKSRRGTLQLFDRTSLQRLFIVESVLALMDKERTQLAEELQSKLKSRVIHGHKALTPSLFHHFFCRH